MNGWIKLHRSLLNWEWFTDPKVAHFFTYCLLKASHNNYRWRGKKLDVGQFPFGLNKASIETGLSVRSIRTCINKLKSTNELTIVTSTQGSVITVVNWNKFQNATSDTANERQTSDKQTTTTNKVNNKNKVNNNIIPPDNDPSKPDKKKIYFDIISHLNRTTGSRIDANGTTHRKLIDFWIDKGFVIDDFKHVIDVKYQDWKDNPKMVKFTKRPATLFGKSHFEDYLSQELERDPENDALLYLTEMQQKLNEKMQGEK